MSSSRSKDDDGCLGCLALLAFCAVVAGLMSLAAVVDPFAWMPSVDEMWSDCEEPDGDECDLAERFPGFWGHLLANLAYTAAAVAVAGWFVVAVRLLRRTRVDRLDDAPSQEAYREARTAVLLASAVLLALAALPVVVVAA